MVVSYWTKEGLNILKFFESNHSKDFDCYGWMEQGPSPVWKGRIPGSHSSLEKIFGCFAAGCIPIYWGAENIENYIPKSCFIHYRDFENKEQFYRFIVNMSSERYENYIRAIQDYLDSDQAQIFSPAFFDNLVYEAITR